MTSRTNLTFAGAGVVAGAVLAWTLAAGAASPSPSPSPDSGRGYGFGAPGHPGGPGMHAPLTNGTVTAVDTTAKTVTIKTAADTKTYTVASDSDIDKNGEATLADLKVGDAVRFATTTAGGSTIAVLHAGDEAKDRPAFGGPGGPGHHGMHGVPLTGTVTAVDTSAKTVTIKTSTATTTYTVTSDSDIDKNGEATLGDLKVGDAVRFATTTTGGTTIAILHAGDEAKDMPHGGHFH